MTFHCLIRSLQVVILVCIIKLWTQYICFNDGDNKSCGKIEQNSHIFSNLENQKTLDDFMGLNIYLCTRKQWIEKGELSKFRHDKQLFLEDAFPKLLNEVICDITRDLWFRLWLSDLFYTWILIRKKWFLHIKEHWKNYKKVFLFCSTSSGVFKDMVLLCSPYCLRNYTEAQAVLESLWLPSPLCWDSRSSHCHPLQLYWPVWNVLNSISILHRFLGEFLFLFVCLFVFWRQSFSV